MRQEVQKLIEDNENLCLEKLTLSVKVMTLTDNLPDMEKQEEKKDKEIQTDLK